MANVGTIGPHKSLKQTLVAVYQSGWLVHSLRTALATTLSLILARLFSMPEPYWAAVTTLVVMQSTLGASWDVSRRRIIGTAIGSLLGGLMATYLHMNLILFTAGLFVLGLACGLAGLDSAAYRFAGVAFAIVTVITRGGKLPAYIIAFHRFAEVTIGIAVALALSALWPEHDKL